MLSKTARDKALAVFFCTLVNGYANRRILMCRFVIDGEFLNDIGR